MSAYVRELLMDNAIGRSALEDRVDFHDSVRRLYYRGIVSSRHVRALRAYLAGYSVDEIRLVLPNAKDLLIQIFAALEQDTQYQDEHIVRVGIQKYPKYAKIAPAIRRQLVKMSLNPEERL